MLEKHLIPKTNPVANAKQVYCEDGLRITVLTPRLIRVETGSTFCDQATQVVWFRDLEPVDYGVEKSRLGVKITTSSAVFFYSFLKESVTYVLLGDKKIKLKNIKKQNLGGTTRSLDNTVKSVRIGEGIASLTGVAVLTDKSLMLCGDGMLEQRATGTTDTYIFAHGLDYVGALADYYKITGPIPLIPRAALGNWWSRWKAYSQDEYINLMKRFKSEYIPFSMATIDMDWHIVNVKKYFPDYVSE
ncbi:MAG: alpha-xylosidase, partial [Firmicutes bacterium]|nr:alpha-xylosidase [Bacillota bacterium]